MKSKKLRNQLSVECANWNRKEDCGWGMETVGWGMETVGWRMETVVGGISFVHRLEINDKFLTVIGVELCNTMTFSLCNHWTRNFAV